MLVMEISSRMSGSGKKLGPNSGAREQGMDRIDGGACRKRCTWTVLNPDGDHSNDEVYCKRD